MLMLIIELKPGKMPQRLKVRSRPKLVPRAAATYGRQLKMIMVDIGNPLALRMTFMAIILNS